MIDLTGPVSPARTHNSRPGIWHEPDARHDLNSLKIHLLLEGGVRSDSSSGRRRRQRAVRFSDERIFERCVTASRFAEEAIDGEQLRTGTSRLRKNLEKVTAELAGISRIPDLGDIPRADDISLARLELPIDRRRAIIKATMTITVVSPGHGARKFRPAQEIKIGWKKPR